VCVNVSLSCEQNAAGSIYRQADGIGIGIGIAAFATREYERHTHASASVSRPVAQGKTTQHPHN